jgi:hypothetical protein
MGIFTELPEHITEVEIVVAGGKQTIIPLYSSKTTPTLTSPKAELLAALSPHD